jgi:hypothetical protein
MAGIKSQHSRLFEQRLAEHRAALVESMTGGVPPDYPAYRQLVGQIQGVDVALRISQEADAILSGEDPNGGA